MQQRLTGAILPVGTDVDMCQAEHCCQDKRPRGRPKTTWREIVEKVCQARGLNREDAMDVSG